MYTFLLIMYLVITVVMVIVVLLQSGSGGMGAIGGGSSTGSVFGGSGSDMFLNKLTGWLALAFMILSIILVRFTSKDESSIAKKYAKKAIPNTATTLKKGVKKEDIKKKDIKKKDTEKKDTEKKDK